MKELVRYSENLIEEIRTNNDIVDVISQYVVLKRSGRNFFGLCPFHKEKSQKHVFFRTVYSRDSLYKRPAMALQI